MAIRTSTQSGNTHSAPFAFGTTVNDGDQLQITNAAHAINFDQSCSIGFSPCTTQQPRPTASITGATGNLPAGAYRARIAAVGSTGITTASAPTGTLTVTGTPPTASFPRITLPALPAGATSWNVYLTNTSTATGTERLYASGQAPGTFDCTSASWTNGTTTYAAADALPFGNALGYPTNITTHTGGITIAAGVTVTVKGDFLILGDLTLGVGSILETDAAASPSALANYSCPGFGTVDAVGTGKLIMRGSSVSRAIVRGKSGTAPGKISTSSTFNSNGAVRLDCEWARFSNLGGSGFPAIDCYNNGAYDQLLTDVVVDADCRDMNLRSIPATGGWNFTRVAFLQTTGATHNSRECGVAFNPAANKSTGLRTCTSVVFELPVALCSGGALWDGCYFGNSWTNSSVGGVTAASELRNCFVRKLQADATNGIASPTTNHDCTDNYLYHDWITGGGTDTNPWGVEGKARGLGTTAIHDGWTFEYNGSAGTGDAIFPDNTSGTVRYQNCLVLPNAADSTSGNICTLNSLNNADMHVEVLHNTYVGENGGIVTSEGTASPAGMIAKLQSNLIYSPVGTSTGNSRYALSKSAGTGDTDTLDVADPAFTSHNAGWNLVDVTGSWTGAYGFYNTRFSVDPTANDIDLGTNPGADLSTNGPKFVDPTRRFHTWAEIELGATGTTAQKITYGLNRLKAIADTTSVDHVVGLEMTDPATWVRDGFAPQNALLQDAGHDGVTIGAVEGVFDGGVLTAPAVTLVSKTDTTVTLSWPAATGGTAPYTYDIEQSPAGAGTWTTAATNVTSPHQITGLTSNTAYDFRIKVTDSAP